MDFSAEARHHLQRLGGLGAVALFHILAVYALVTGLAHRIIDTVKRPLDIRIVEEIKPPPEMRPPPSPRLHLPPPPFIPPPEVPVAQPPEINPIAAASREAPQDHSFQKQPEAAAPQASLPSPLEQKGRAKADWDTCMPHYPTVSMDFEEEGTTRIRFEVDANSTLKEATLIKSSGYARLDKAALKALSQCAFHPAIKDGKPIASALVVEFVWSLSGGGWQ